MQSQAVLGELSPDTANLLALSEIQWVNAAKIMYWFLSLLPEIKAFIDSRNRDNYPINKQYAWFGIFNRCDSEIRHLACELQGKKTIAIMIRALKTCRSKLSFLVQQLLKR